MMRRNITANYFGVGWTMLMGIAFLPLCVRYLGMEAYGLVGILAAIQAWLILLDAGVTPALIRESSRLKFVGDFDELRRVLRTSEWLAGVAAITSLVIVTSLAVLLARHWIKAETIDSSIVVESLVLMGFIIAFRFGESVLRAAFIGLERQVTLNVLMVITSTVRSAGVVAVLAWVSNSVLAYFLWQAAVSVLTVLLYSSVLYARLPGARAGSKFSRPTLSRIWRFSAGTFLIAVLGTFLSQTDKVVLSFVLPLREFGFYAFAAVVAGFISSLVQPVFQAVYPQFVALAAAGEEARLARLYHQSCQLVTVLLSSSAVWLIVFANRILVLWTGDAVFAAQVAPTLSILVIGSALNGLVNGPYYLQIAEGWTSLLLRTNFVMALILVPTIWFAARTYGALGGAGTWVTVNAIYLIVLVDRMHRRILRGEKVRWYIVDLLVPTAAALAGALLCRKLIGTAASAWLNFTGLALGGLMTLACSALSAPLVRSGIPSLTRRQCRA